MMLIAAILVVWECSKTDSSPLATRFCRFVPGPNVGVIAIFALPVLYVAQIALLAAQFADRVTYPRYEWLAKLPIPVFDGDHGTTHHDAMFSAIGLGVGVLEGVALALVAIALRKGQRLPDALVAAVTLTLAVSSVLGPTLATTDPYEYVATGMLGFASYAPPAHAFVGTIYEAIGRHIPLTGVIYGPLWIVSDIVQTSLGATVFEKIEALRVTNVGFVFVALALLRACKLPRFVLIAFAVNPVLWFYTVANPHADIQGIVYVAAALYFARRSLGVLAVVCVVAAGLVKLPFVIVGGAMLSLLTGTSKRIALWFGAVAIVLGVSYALTSHAYVRAIGTYVAREHGLALSQGWTYVVPIVALSILVLLVSRRSFIGIAVLTSQAGPIGAPWYLYWGLPIALVGGLADAYLAALPFLATLLEDRFELPVDYAIALLLMTVCVYDRVYLRRAPRAAPVASQT